ncbi:MAG: AI-2E family transporter [Hyphomicrobiales bacterium]|nr:AI-2E family transporter [Hyphomicrobiales bacterium]
MPLTKIEHIATRDNPQAVYKAAASVALFLMIATTLYLGREVLTPIAFAIVLAFVLSPIVLRLRPWLGRGLSVTAAVIVTVAVVVSFAGLFAYEMKGLAGDLPKYRDSIAAKVQSAREATVRNPVLGGLSATLSKITSGVDEPQPATEGGPTHVVIDKSGLTAEGVLSAFGQALSPIMFALISLIFLIFVLLQREDLRDRFIRLVGANDLSTTVAAMDDAATRLGAYFLAQSLLNAAFGLYVAIGLWLIGLPAAAMWGLLAMVLRFVPYIGSAIAAAIPILLAAAIDPGWSIVAMTTLLFLVGEPLMGQIIEPLVYGKSTGLSPIAVVVSAAFWTLIWGPAGLLLSTPLTLCLVVLGRYVDGLSFLEILFGDAPALTPSESLYHRLISGDLPETAEIAEDALERQKIDEFYGQVAVPALLLARNERDRGSLDAGAQTGVRDALRDLVGELAEHGDDQPAASIPADLQSERAILSIGARSALDDGAAILAGDLLRRRGYGVSFEPHDVLRSDGIFRIDPDGVKIVFLSTLDGARGRSHMRYVVRKLRRRLPNASIAILSLSGADRTSEIAQEAGDADFQAARLSDLVDVVARVAQGGRNDKAAPAPAAIASAG